TVDTDAAVYGIGQGTHTVTRRDGIAEIYKGSMWRGTFDSVLQPAGQSSEYTEGNRRSVGRFNNGRFSSGQIYINDKLDYDGSVYASGRYATGKTYFDDGRYIDGTFVDRSDSVSTGGKRVQIGIVYTADNKPQRWIFQEKPYSSEAAWNKAISQQREAEERKARNEATLNGKLDALFTRMDSQITARPGDSEAMLAYYSQNRDVAQAKVTTLDKMINACRTSSCDYLGLLQTRRDREYQTYQSHVSSYDSTQESIASAARMQALLGALEQVAVSSGRVDAARYQQAKAQQQQLSNALSRLTTSGSSVESANNLAEIYMLMKQD
ncbi:MAG: hypothetical protein VW625_06575, partial [Perlucidibaca sp.]